jgi:hypothetical protein
MKFEDLIQLCIECMSGYRPDIEGPDSHAEKVMKKVNQ